MSIQNLTSDLRKFKLSGMVNSLEYRIKYANDNSLSYQEFLQILWSYCQILCIGRFRWHILPQQNY